MSRIVSPLPELEIGGGEVETGAAELRDPDLERDARPRRRLLEDHAERPAGEEVRLLAGGAGRLQLVGEVEHRQPLVARPVGDTREAPPAKPFRDRDHAPILASCISQDDGGTSRPHSGEVGRMKLRGFAVAMAAFALRSRAAGRGDDRGGSRPRGRSSTNPDGSYILEIESMGDTIQCMATRLRPARRSRARAARDRRSSRARSSARRERTSHQATRSRGGSRRTNRLHQVVPGCSKCQPHAPSVRMSRVTLDGPDRPSVQVPELHGAHPA